MKQLAVKLIIIFLSITVARAEILIGVAGPMTGSRAWSGQQFQRGAELAVANINAAGGVLGQQLKLIIADDANDLHQAKAVASKLVSDRVSLVVGHRASDMTRAVTDIYAAAGIIQITPSSTNPELTEQGIQSLFRVCGRDDQQAILAGGYLAQSWKENAIGIIHDKSSYGSGLARATQKYLNEQGVREMLFHGFAAGELDYSSLLNEVKRRKIEALYVGAYSAESALIVRQARDAGIDFQLISGDALHNSDFWLIAGEAGKGARFTFDIDPRSRPQADAIVQQFRKNGYEPEGYTLHTYAAIQIWASAAQNASSVDYHAVAKIMHEIEFDTVLGPIEFDHKGDLRTHSYTWYTWQNGEPVRR
ncbi:MAG: branched-chain amino acid ABC transporter substrate-binding protein [Gammaproteobacteria bacterium]|nr:branched-chain amino acid ABC transporter substrate-binding protein [Gammaproteobacteria bacterium]